MFNFLKSFVKASSSPKKLNVLPNTPPPNQGSSVIKTNQNSSFINIEPNLPQLSKQEYFSILALQGILASATYFKYDDAIDDAVIYANKLISRLDADRNQ